jgi:hypothetical protein
MGQREVLAQAAGQEEHRRLREGRDIGKRVG